MDLKRIDKLNALFLRLMASPKLDAASVEAIAGGTTDRPNRLSRHRSLTVGMLCRRENGREETLSAYVVSEESAICENDRFGCNKRFSL